MNTDSKKSVRVGVVGCGAIADLYHLPALLANSRTTHGICLAEPNADRLKQMAEKYRAVRSVQDYKDLEGHVDGVIIATPPSTHYEISLWFLRRKIHVLCEKPLSESLDQARELVQAAKDSGVSLMVNQTRRFFPTYQKIRSLIREGVLGEIQSIAYHDGMDFDWPAASPHHFKPGAKGAWSDTGVHLLDSACYWLDAKPEFVSSHNDSMGGPEAMATVKLKHQGCDVEIKVSRLGRLMNGFRIVGSLGSIEAEAEDWDEFTVKLNQGGSRRFPCASNRLKYNDFAKPLIENLVQVIAEGAQPTVSGESVLGTTELLEKAYEAPMRYATPWNQHFPAWKEDARFHVQDHAQPMRVLVTGVSGFVGSRVVEAMNLSGLMKPIAAIRGWSRASRVARYSTEMVVCDILNPEQVDRAMKGIDAVVHCAYTDDRESIVEGTRNLLQAASQRGIEKFVYLSSAEVYGPNRLGTVDESENLLPLGRPYGDAKLEAESLCKNFASQGIISSILRPSLIYGPFGGSWSMDVAKRLQSGRWGLFENHGDGIANLVYIDDLVQSIFLCLADTSRKSHVFNVNGPTQPTWNQYFSMFNEALGLPPLVKISSSQSKWRSFAMDCVRKTTSTIKSKFEDQLMEIYLRGGWAGRMMKKLKGRLDTTPSGGELTDLYSRQAKYDDRSIRETLGYLPQFDLERGIAMTIQWMILHELISKPHLVREYSQKPVEQPSDAVLA